MRKIAPLTLAAFLLVAPAHADFTAKDASTATITFKNPNTCSSVVCVPIFAQYDSTGSNAVAVLTAGADAASNTATGALSYSRNLWFNGTTWDRATGDLTNGLWVNVKASALPSGAATAAAQTTAQTSLSSIDTKTPALGQALAAASVPVILPAATVTTLTPPAAITGFSTSTKQSDGTQKTQIVDGTGSVIASTSNNLNVQCANCSGSGVSTADAASFTPSTSLFAGTGGFFQTTATNNALTNLQQGMLQMTATRAAFANLRNAAGAEVGTAAAPLQVSVANTAGNATAIKVDGSAVTQPVSLASVPSHAVTVASGGIASGAVASGAVASGAVTSGAYAAGALAAGAFASGSGVDGWDLTQGAKADSVCGTATGTCSVVALLKYLNASVSAAVPAGTAIIGKVGIDQTTPGTTNAVSATGAAASGATASGNPVAVGGLGVSSETVVTAGQAAALITDLARKLIVLPYANPENFVSGVITSAMTGTTTTSLIAAPAAGLRNYITACTFSNSHATVGTDMILQDGSGGTAIWNVPAAAVYGGAHITFPAPLRQPTTATAIFVANVTTGASTKAACSGYKGA